MADDPTVAVLALVERRAECLASETAGCLEEVYQSGAPGLHADLAVHTWPVVNHQHEFAAACVSETGDRTMLDGAKALALTALAVASDPGVLAREGSGPGR